MWQVHWHRTTWWIWSKFFQKCHLKRTVAEQRSLTMGWVRTCALSFGLLVCCVYDFRGSAGDYCGGRSVGDCCGGGSVGDCCGGGSVGDCCGGMVSWWMMWGEGQPMTAVGGGSASEWCGRRVSGWLLWGEGQWVTAVGRGSAGGCLFS